MQLTSEFIPSSELVPFIESYSYIEKNGKVTIDPQGVTYIILSLNPDRIQLRILPISEKVQSISLLKSSILIRCKAFVIPPSWNELYEFNTIDLNEDSREALISENTSEHLTLNHTINSILNKDFNLDNKLRKKVNYILERKGHVNISEMAEQFRTSRQSLHKEFNLKLKIGPKKLAKIWKLNNFLFLYKSGYSAVEASLISGYFDQAHLINDFKCTYGLPPKKFLTYYPSFSIDSIQKRFFGAYDPKE